MDDEASMQRLCRGQFCASEGEQTKLGTTNGRQFGFCSSFLREIKFDSPEIPRPVDDKGRVTSCAAVEKRQCVCVGASGTFFFFIQLHKIKENCLKLNRNVVKMLSGNLKAIGVFFR